MIDVPPGTIVVYSDIGCPWAHLAVFRLHRARHEAGLDDRVRFDHRAFPLELFNRRPTPKRSLDAEIPVVGGRDPGAGWRMWTDRVEHWPVTMLPALEAVQAAKQQGLEAGEQLDRALRVAFFGESRCISMRHVVLDVAAACPAVDADDLAAALDDGRARHTVREQYGEAERESVKGSPHVFLPGGRDEHNPGIAMHWEGEHGVGFPVVDRDEVGVYVEIVEAAASMVP